MRLCLPVAAVVAVLVAGCGDTSETSGPTPLSLALDFTPNAAHAPIYAATRTHADTKRGVKLRILGPGSGTPDSLKLVTSGRADVGVLDIHDLGLAAERGADVVGIGALVQRPLAAVIARRAIKRPRDLAEQCGGVKGRPSAIPELNAVVLDDSSDI